ncbi:MAG: chromosomal replication initiator protein DnaA [Leptospiraceae bacterium]|nr:chromosomal replication initiator protein DnaA [Leptospiraceae bacterium]MCK6379942.1 chromosomal replication initiator protein DnaA [Leptospiraceae bacterium]NUM41463.1 chromosomal replication initiator protein DnaA [Leptospiraceae bacterium]
MENFIWENIQKEISKNIPPAYFEPFIAPLTLIGFNEDKCSIKAPSLQIKNHVEKKYQHFIENAIFSIKGNRFKVEILLDTPAELKTIVEEKYSDDNFSFNPDYTFESFIVGETNQFAFSAAKEVGNRPGVLNPLYIFGEYGVGKTHLLHSIGSSLKKEQPWTTVKYIDILSFMFEFQYAVQNRTTMESFKIKYQSYNTLIVDDIQNLNSGAEKTQEQFFSLFNHFYDRRRQIIIASDRPSHELPIHDRLKSRFVTGVQVDIKAPSYDVRYKILKKHSDSLNLNLSENTLSFIAEKIIKDTRSLLGALNDLFLYKKTYNIMLLDDEKIKEIIDSRISYRNKIEISNDRIIDIVCSFFSQNKKDILSKSRKAEFIQPRHVCMYFLNELSGLNKTVIGRIFQIKHTAVIHAIKHVKLLSNSNPEFSIILKKIQSEIEFK